LKLKLEEYRYKNPQRGHGGAIADLGFNILLGKSDNNFSRINTTSWISEDNYLPPLETGGENLKNSRRYKYREMTPRIEGLLNYQGTYYVSYTKYDAASDFIYFVIDKIEGTSDWKNVYQSPGLDAPYYTIGSGGRMVALDGKLFFTVGDFSLDRLNGLSSDVAPQNPSLPWGKVNYIDLANQSFHVWTLGHRNPQGLLVLSDGRIIAAEHGPQGGDELNILESGGNYGWPFESFGTKYGSYGEYKDDLPAPSEDPIKFKKPLFAFVPSPAISQLIEVKKFHSKWNGDILLGSLKAKTLFHIRIDKDKVIFVEPIPINHRIRDIKQIDSSIYILTDEGSILKITHFD